jgi:hypothetical protein
MSELLKIVSSQYKHLPGRMDDFIDPRTITSGTLMRNEPFSFQALYRAPEKSFCLAVSVAAKTTLPIEAYRVDYVAAVHAANPNGEPGYESDAPGLFPDILLPRPAAPEIIALDTAWGYCSYFEKNVDHLLNATANDFQSVWFTVNPDSRTLNAGEYDIVISLTSLTDRKLLAEKTLTLTVLDAELPANDTYYTNWFHVDCVCDAFGVKPYSTAFYRIFDRYIANMTRHRQNTLLLPAFTPPLDTAVGAERMNVQLIDIERDADGWHFDFTKMRRFVRHAKKGGIRYFEHCHLFSQWGAEHAPNIYNKNGSRIFDFETDATGDEYIEFLRSYLPAFFDFARKEGIAHSLVFHLSDEPTLKHLASYRSAHDTVADLISGNPIADAMAAIEFYQEGLVDHPIYHVNHADDFADACPTKWLYYTGGTYEKKCSNRMVSNTAALTRVIGVQLYRYQALGFLHWAYNFYYDRLSMGYGDPRSALNTYKMYPGITHLCYPITGRGENRVVPSIREKLMAEAFDDLRALKLLESKIGRQETLAICESKLGPITCRTIPEGEALRELRETVNRAIALYP